MHGGFCMSPRLCPRLWRNAYHAKTTLLTVFPQRFTSPSTEPAATTRLRPLGNGCAWLPFCASTFEEKSRFETAIPFLKSSHAQGPRVRFLLQHIADTQQHIAETQGEQTDDYLRAVAEQALPAVVGDSPRARVPIGDGSLLRDKAHGLQWSEREVASRFVSVSFSVARCKNNHDRILCLRQVLLPASSLLLKERETKVLLL